MASFLWPFSPCLGLYTCLQRRYLNIIYKDDYYSNIFNWSEAARACVWPCAIVQHLIFLQRRQREGLLRFDWEYEHDVLADLLAPKPRRTDKVVLIVGPSGAGKTQLFKKVLGVTLGSTRLGRHDTKLRIGVKPLRVSDSEMIFLELWDVPVAELAVTMAEMSSKRLHVDVLLLVFDSTSIDSFEELRAMYRSLVDSIASLNNSSSSNGNVNGAVELDRVRKVCVGSKVDQAPSNDWFVRSMAEEWACKESMPFESVSSLSNHDMNALLKTVVAAIFASPISIPISGLVSGPGFGPGLVSGPSTRSPREAVSVSASNAHETANADAEADLLLNAAAEDDNEDERAVV